MKRLFMGEGLSGIGLYWCIVEMLYEKGGYIELEYIPIIAFDLRTTEDTVHNVIEKYGLFNSNDTHFYSNGVLNRLNLRAEKSEKARKSVEARWNKSKANNDENTDEIRTYNDSNTIKENKIKEKENIEKNIEKKKIYDDIISHLNEKAGTNYRSSSKATQGHINARLAENRTVEDFYTVIDKKCAEWIGTDMEKYLRPETLFGNKFENYLNAPVSQPTQNRQAQQPKQNETDEFMAKLKAMYHAN
jgi:uncharacterized phage protein (TIGR02220 family)